MNDSQSVSWEAKFDDRKRILFTRLSFSSGKLVKRDQALTSALTELPRSSHAREAKPFFSSLEFTSIPTLLNEVFPDTFSTSSRSVRTATLPPCTSMQHLSPWQSWRRTADRRRQVDSPSMESLRLLTQLLWMLPPSPTLSSVLSFFFNIVSRPVAHMASHHHLLNLSSPILHMLPLKSSVSYFCSHVLFFRCTSDMPAASKALTISQSADLTGVGGSWGRVGERNCEATSDHQLRSLAVCFSCTVRRSYSYIRTNVCTHVQHTLNTTSLLPNTHEFDRGKRRLLNNSLLTRENSITGIRQIPLG